MLDQISSIISVIFDFTCFFPKRMGGLMNKKIISLRSLVGLCLIITVILLSVASCENSPSEPEKKEFQMWTLRGGMGEGALYHNSPENFEGNAISLNGLSANITPLYLTYGNSYLWSVGVTDNHAKKILRIDPLHRIVIERNITSAMLDSKPEGIAWSNGLLWCVYLAGDDFIVCTLDPDTLTETIQMQFSFYFYPDYMRIRGIDIDEMHNQLWIGRAIYSPDGILYYHSYEAFNLTTGELEAFVYPDHFADLWAGDIKVGDSYIWSNAKDERGNTMILKTFMESGQTHRMYTIDAGAEGIEF